MMLETLTSLINLKSDFDFDFFFLIFRKKVKFVQNDDVKDDIGDEYDNYYNIKMMTT